MEHATGSIRCRHMWCRRASSMNVFAKHIGWLCRVVAGGRRCASTCSVSHVGDVEVCNRRQSWLVAASVLARASASTCMAFSWAVLELVIISALSFTWFSSSHSAIMRSCDTPNSANSASFTLARIGGSGSKPKIKSSTSGAYTGSYTTTGARVGAGFRNGATGATRTKRRRAQDQAQAPQKGRPRAPSMHLGEPLLFNSERRAKS